ncbi:MAG: hypothetical protein II942_01570 [Alphaproteobacteria bacterium]|nr:hypothetical protein [Alphaproteobacteria bacterium]
MTEHKTTAWHLTRLLMVVCWAVWIVTFFIVVTLFQAVLQVNVLAQVFRLDSGEFRDLITVIPVSALQRQTVDDALVRLYVTMRYSFISDSVEMTRRWGPNGIVAFLSAPKVYDEFAPSEDIYTSADENSQQKVVDIISATRKENYYAVIFDLYEATGRGTWRKSTRSVVLHFGYMPARRLMGSVLSNPYGFIITSVDESNVTK